MSRTCGAVERRQRDRAVMRAHAPGRPELGPGGGDDEQRRQRAAFGDAAQQVERGRIGPMQIFEREHRRLRPSRPAITQLVSAASCRRRNSSGAKVGARSGGSGMSSSGASKRSILRRVELDQRQRVLQVREALLGGHVGAAEALAAPFGDRMQRRVLQELRAAPFDPGVRRLAQPA